MRTTVALSARMKQFLANLHPPSPPTAKEGQQLLGLLRGSFQRRLDEVHPNPWQSTPAADHDHPIARLSPSANAAASHFGSVLAHPYLSSLLDGLDTHNEDATTRFGALVAQPHMDYAKLSTLLKQHDKYLKDDPQLQAQRESDLLGCRLSDWLLSAPYSTQERFFTDSANLKAAADMLVTENNESILWHWLEAVYKRPTLSITLQSTVWLDAEDRLVCALMRTAVRRNDLNDAAHQFEKACQYRIDSGRPDPYTMRPQPYAVAPQHDRKSRTMWQSGACLASAILFRRHNHHIEPALFDRLVQFFPTWASGPQYSRAICSIYSPTHASFIDLYRKLRDPVHADALLQHQRRAKKHWRRTILTAILDASNLALKGDHRQEAAFLLDFAIDHYPDMLPARKTEDFEPQLETYLNLVPG